MDGVICGDCLDELPKIDDNSIDAIVTDPPAGISFMGKEWDKDKGGRNAWISWMSQVAAECLRVTKPGGHALVWALPRTSHWTGMAWEEAGWEPRDKIAHVFGSGFPKSLDISKALDKMAGAEREIIGKRFDGVGSDSGSNCYQMNNGHSNLSKEIDITAPTTPAAKQWAGFGTALKPAHEDWWLFRKPLACKTIAENVLEWGCGGLNIDGCRIGVDGGCKSETPYSPCNQEIYGSGLNNQNSPSVPGLGRFPSNMIWSHSPLCKRIGTKKVKGNAHYSYKPTNDGVYKLGLGQLDDLGNPLAGADGMETVESWDCHPSCPTWEFAKAGESKSNGFRSGGRRPTTHEGYQRPNKTMYQDKTDWSGGSDEGTPARFFKSCQFTEEDLPAFAYYAKASKSERGEGNNHPTVKSLSLMRYLVKLITPPNGLILDPFTGSGTTLLAAKQEGFRFIGIEKEAEYCDICRKRIAAVPTSLDKWL